MDYLSSWMGSSGEAGATATTTTNGPGENGEPPKLPEPEKTWEVTDDEMKQLKAHLHDNYPGADELYMNDDYLRSIASKPYTQDMTKRRPLDYTMKKISTLMDWRKDNKAPEMPYWMELAIKCEDGVTCPDPNFDEGDWEHVKLLVGSLNSGSTYIHGHTKDGKPIVWVRTERKAWFPDADSEANTLILLLDAAIRNGMPDGVTDFTIISDSHSPPPPMPTCVYKMLNGLVKGYPDRMHVLISAPVSTIVETVMGLLLPLMPGRLADKFVFMNLEHVTDKFEHILLNGHDDIPKFFGGPADHDTLYPAEADNTNIKGMLKFDYYGMIDRLKEQRDQYNKEYGSKKEELAN